MGRRPAEELPPVAVSCTGQECGHQFLSRAARHAVVRCPRCKRNLRVKRPRPHGWKRKRPSSPAPGKRKPSESVRKETAGSPEPRKEPRRPQLVAAAAASEDPDDDDGYAYMPDATGRLVLVDLTPEGVLVPVRLVDQRFRLIAPGCCSVYGCTDPARWPVDGWPVCPEHRRELTAATQSGLHSAAHA
jgi:hypothetical protein